MKNQKLVAAKQIEKSLTQQSCTHFMLRRRAFIAAGSISVLGAVTFYTKADEVLDIESVILTKEFHLLFDVAFPATQLKLDALRRPAIERLTGLDYGDAFFVIALLNHFKIEIQTRGPSNDRKLSFQEGEESLEAIIRKKPDIANKGLDIIYREISKVKNFRETLWNREISLWDRKCAYWENYDVKPNS